MRLLFTCMGTSDPVRGYRDGPLLHILRHYRPEKLVIILTREMAELVERDDRIGAMVRHMEAKWDGYRPEIRIRVCPIQDPSDLDQVSGPLTEQLKLAAAQVPEGEILLNLSSGTPQMDQVLAMLAADMRYPRTVGIQVKSPERSSGRAERTNKADYSVEAELECNEDEDPGAERRCTEPKMLHLKKQQARDQILALLDQRDYSAIYAMKDSMPDKLKALVGHLDARDRLQDGEARKRAQSLRLPFPLYPARPVKGYSDYGEVSEAYLVLLNRQHRHQYEELVLRLNPLVVRLQLRLMDRALRLKGMRLEDVICRPWSPRPRFQPDRLRSALPQVYAQVEKAYGPPLRESDVSISLCCRILEALPGTEEKALDLLKKCDDLNDSCRNQLAHQLSSVTASQIRDACGMEPAQLLRELGELIADIYPQCDPSLFTIYKRCGEYIKDQLL